MHQLARIITLLVLLRAAAWSGDGNESHWKRYALTAGIVTTFAALGINEGQKWSDNYSLVMHEDYHAYRMVTNAGIVGLPILALTMNPDRQNMKWALVGGLMGWGAYECTLAWASGRGPLDERPDFRILGMSMPWPRPIGAVLLSAGLSAAVVWRL